MLHVIYRLPTPIGGSVVIGSIITDTPLSPPPAERRDSEETVRAGGSAEEREEAEVVFDAADTAEDGGMPRAEPTADETPRAPGRTGRIPGDYWVSGPDRR